MFSSVRGPDRFYIDNQPLYFHQMTPREVIRAQEKVPTYLIKRLPDHRPELAKKSQNQPQNGTFRSVRGTHRCYIDKTTLFSLNLSE